MKSMRTCWLTIAFLSLGSGASPASATYWALFNIEGESRLAAGFATYATRSDMLNDTNRTGVFTPTGGGPFDANIVGTGYDGSVYWNAFNIEGESRLAAGYATYATLTDMLNDTNRLGVFTPTGGGTFDANIVDASSDGANYWALFNIEGESHLAAGFATYGSRSDMLNDTNRLAVYTPTGGGPFDANIVGTGYDGSVYWNVFNIEGESSLAAGYATYATFIDMLNDTNRLGVFTPTGGGPFDANIVGAGSDEWSRVPAVPEPSTWVSLIAGFIALGTTLRRFARTIPAPFHSI